MKPRPHQTEAVAAIVAGFDSYDRGQIHMACGSGKTLVGLLAAAAMDAKQIVVFLPSLALVRQSIDAYEDAACWSRWRALAVCSDAGVSRVGVPCPVTENHAEVEEFLASGGIRVVFATYHSADRLAGLEFDLGLFDEAHRTAGEDADRLFAFALQADAIRIRKRLFMTATPRHMPDTGAEDYAYSMHDEVAYGPVFYRLSLRSAIAQGLICDYRLVVSVKLRDDLGIEAHARTAAQAAVVHAMNRYQLQKAISFHHRIVDAERFVDPDFPFGSIETMHINGSQPMAERQATLDAFRAAPRALLSNARCLSEGIDVPAVDLVAFVDRKTSAVDIVQALGRAVRHAPGKTMGYVLLPLLVDQDANFVDDDAASHRRYRALFAVLRALSEQDELVATALRRYRDQIANGEPPDPLPGVEVIFADEAPLTLTERRRLIKAVTTKIVDSLAPRGWSMEYRKHLLLTRARAGGRRPKRRQADPIESCLAQALARYAIRSEEIEYDPAFSAAIREARPDWFVQSSRKRELLDRARQGGPRPGPKREPRLYDMLLKFTRLSSKSYDPTFVEELLAIAPHWATRPQRSDDAARKDRLLLRAEQGLRAPTTNCFLGLALVAYIAPECEFYDAAFTDRLMAVRPEWVERLRAAAAHRSCDFDPERAARRLRDERQSKAARVRQALAGQAARERQALAGFREVVAERRRRRREARRG